MDKSKVVVRSVKNADLRKKTKELLEVLDFKKIIKPSAKVVIKLNLCEFNKEKVKAANVSKEFTQAVVETIKEITSDIFLVEAHSYRAPAEIAFKNTGIYEIAKKTGAKIVNLSKDRLKKIENPLLSPLPEIILENDVFIDIAKLKTHALTYFTGVMKNLWGCLPRYDRIALHKYLDELIVELNKILKPKICLIDGILGMDQRGPTNGRERRLDIILGSTDAIALDATAMRLVGLKPEKAKHVVLGYQKGLGRFREEEIELDMDFERYWSDFEEAKLDWAIRAMNYLTRYSWFRKYILGPNWIFYPVKKLVNFLRKIGIVR